MPIFDILKYAKTEFVAYVSGDPSLRALALGSTLSFVHAMTGCCPFKLHKGPPKGISARKRGSPPNSGILCCRGHCLSVPLSTSSRTSMRRTALWLL